MSGKIDLTRWLIAFVTSLGMGWTVFAAQVIYVDAGATGANDGTSWVDAYKYLQDALADANSVEKPAEVRVAQGIYRPDRASAEPNGTGDREATFGLINGVTLKGGYAGSDEPDPDGRHIALYETVLSGDLRHNDVEVGDPWDLWDQPSRAENSYHVVTASGTNPTAVLEGFTIAAGNADGEGDDQNQWGGGACNVNGSPLVANCAFTENTAFLGGGIFTNSGRLTLNRCKFTRNFSYLVGGGTYSVYGCPTVVNCVYEANWAFDMGGGIFNGSGSLRLANCSFVANLTVGVGGAIHNHSSGTRLTYCVFSGNSAHYGGGGMYNEKSDSTLVNCTFSGNIAHGDTSVVGPVPIVPHGGSIFSDEGDAMLSNCVLWGNEPEEIYVSGGTALVSYSDVGGDWPGEGNIDVDPCFVDPGHWEDPCDTPLLHVDNVWVDGDYHLKSEGGRWDPAAADWIQDDVTSPCIDAGDMSSFLGFEPFANGGVINMGAYGGTAEASKSYFGEPVCETIVAGDINGDCRVDFGDFRIMACHWLEGR